MGNATTTLISDSTTVNVDFFIEIRPGVYKPLASVTDGKMTIQETLITRSAAEDSQAFVGQLSADVCTKSKHEHLHESQKIVMKAIYALPVANIGIPNFQGTGHIIFRNKCKCTSIQLCLESLAITGTTATATYYGYLEKAFNIEPRLDTKIDACVTFMAVCKAP